jgi:hypothetical protein
MKRRLWWHVGEIAVLLLAHVVLIHWMAEKQLASAIFAAGEHTPRSVLLVAGGFLLVRLLAVLFLPSIILSRVVLLLLRWRQDRAEK